MLKRNSFATRALASVGRLYLGGGLQGHERCVRRTRTRGGPLGEVRPDFIRAPAAAGEGRLPALAVVLLYIDRGRPNFVQTLVIVLCGFTCGYISVETRVEVQALVQRAFVRS
jgi:hypothetical protein